MESIQNELQKERVKQISSLSQDLFYSPIDLASKQTNNVQSEWRVIFDLSSSEGIFVNDDISKEYGTLIYETLNDAIQLMTQMKRETMMMKRDLKATF